MTVYDAAIPVEPVPVKIIVVIPRTHPSVIIHVINRDISPVFQVNVHRLAIGYVRGEIRIVKTTDAFRIGEIPAFFQGLLLHIGHLQTGGIQHTPVVFIHIAGGVHLDGTRRIVDTNPAGSRVIDLLIVTRILRLNRNNHFHTGIKVNIIFIKGRCHGRKHHASGGCQRNDPSSFHSGVD